MPGSFSYELSRVLVQPLSILGTFLGELCDVRPWRCRASSSPRGCSISQNPRLMIEAGKAAETLTLMYF